MMRICVDMDDHSREKGFLLIETLVLGILLLAVSGMLIFYRAAIGLQKHSEFETTAAFLAQEQMACVEAASPARWRNHAALDWMGEGEMPLLCNGCSFMVETAVADGAESFSLRKVRVQVSWTEHGQPQRFALERMVRADAE